MLLVQNSLKNGILAGFRYVFIFVSTRNLFWTCDSAVLSIFRAHDDDVHTESRFYCFEQLDTTSRFNLSCYFIEVLVDSIRRVLSKMK